MSVHAVAANVNCWCEAGRTEWLRAICADAPAETVRAPSLAEAARARGIAFDVVSQDAGTIFSTIAQAYDTARQI
jgi:hypothetical protein